MSTKHSAITTFVYKRVYWIALFLLFLVLIVGYIFFIADKWQYFKEITDLGEQEDQLNQKKLYLNSLKKLNENYKNIDASVVDKIETILPSTAQYPELYYQLEKLAQENGIVVLSMNISEVKNLVKGKEQPFNIQKFLNKTVKDHPLPSVQFLRKYTLKKLKISLTVSGGNYESFKNFLKALENNMRLMDIISLRFDPQAAGYDLHILTYYLKEKINKK